MNRLLHGGDDRSREGSRMPAAHEPCHALRRLASESLQGKNPRETPVADVLHYR
jgi:hypothetical protein